MVKLLLLFALFFVFYYLLKIIIPIFRIVRSGGADNYQNRSRGTKKEGDVTVDYTQGKNKKFGKDDGEYIDYQEVND